MNIVPHYPSLQLTKIDELPPTSLIQNTTDYEKQSLKIFQIRKPRLKGLSSKKNIFFLLISSGKQVAELVIFVI